MSTSNTPVTLLTLANLGCYETNTLTVTLTQGNERCCGNIAVVFNGTHQHICEEIKANFPIDSNALSIPEVAGNDMVEWAKKRLGDYLVNGQLDAIVALIKSMIRPLR